ncbi:hypothetical protein Lalb_Chr04g0257971 [Lupinus albus]|uniref:Uncharacterized protein n=1 Tax=Lupinus albus TaxID=3870 RepID=A0A6A4QR14_LUPAL|nr:hypothetical protein Lalb_Chr04g0257971 [Lupinus albus]
MHFVRKYSSLCKKWKEIIGHFVIIHVLLKRFIKGLNLGTMSYVLMVLISNHSRTPVKKLQLINNLNNIVKSHLTLMSLNLQVASHSSFITQFTVLSHFLHCSSSSVSSFLPV